MAKLVETVRLYMERARQDGEDAKYYPPEQKGIYEIVSGSPESGGRDSLGYYEGRFIDVVAKAVQMDGFAGWWCSHEQADNPNNGYVRLIKTPVVKKVPEVKGLAEAIKTIEGLEKEESGLEEELKKVSKQKRDAAKFGGN